MKRLLILFLLLAKFSFGQEQIDWTAYTQAWVIEKQVLISQSQYLSKFKGNDVRLLFAEDPYLKTENGNKYIKAFLANYSKDSVSVPRSDATIAKVITEVLLKNQWSLFQKKIGASCGNSYWTMVLAPGHFVELQIEDKTEGSVKVPFRVSLKTDKLSITSNMIFIYASEKRLESVGKEIKNIVL